MLSQVLLKEPGVMTINVAKIAKKAGRLKGNTATFGASRPRLGMRLNKLA